MTRSKVVLEVVLYESLPTPCAEWDCWREFEDERSSEWITQGTAPSLFAAIDKASAALIGEKHTSGERSA